MQVSRVFEHFWNHFGPMYMYIALTHEGNKHAHFNGSWFEYAWDLQFIWSQVQILCTPFSI